MELLTNTSLGRYNLTPTNRIHKLQNLGKALKCIEQEGMRLVNIGAENVCDKNSKLILGLLWTLILNYHVGAGGSAAAAAAAAVGSSSTSGSSAPGDEKSAPLAKPGSP